MAQARGDLDRAAELFEQALARFRELRDTWSTARAIGKLGTIAAARGDGDRAYDLGRESLTMYEELRSNEGVAESLLVMADGALLRGDVEQAELLATEALERCRERGFSGQLTWALRCAGTVALRRGDLAASAALLEEGVELYRAGQRRDAGATLLLLGTVRARQRDGDAAATLCQEALSLFQDVGDQRGVARSLVGLADAAVARDEPLAAVRYLAASRVAREGVDGDFPTDDEEYAAVRAALHGALGDLEFDRVWAEVELAEPIDLRELELELVAGGQPAERAERSE